MIVKYAVRYGIERYTSRWMCLSRTVEARVRLIPRYTFTPDVPQYLQCRISRVLLLSDQR